MNYKYLTKYKAGTKRLKGFDYGASRCYFITIDVLNQRKAFGEIANGQIRLSDLGKIAATEWLKTLEMRKSMSIELSDFVVMPDHFHALITINSMENCRTTSPNQFGTQSQNVGSIIRGFKAAVTTYARKNSIDFNWQPRYYDRIMRNPFEIENVRQYIRNNVKNYKSK